MKWRNLCLISSRHRSELDSVMYAERQHQSTNSFCLSVFVCLSVSLCLSFSFSLSPYTYQMINIVSSRAFYFSFLWCQCRWDAKAFVDCLSFTCQDDAAACSSLKTYADDCPHITSAGKIKDWNIYQTNVCRMLGVGTEETKWINKPQRA